MRFIFISGLCNCLAHPKVSHEEVSLQPVRGLSHVPRATKAQSDLGLSCCGMSLVLATGWQCMACTGGFSVIVSSFCTEDQKKKKTRLPSDVCTNVGGCGPSTACPLSFQAIKIFF